MSSISLSYHFFPFMSCLTERFSCQTVSWRSFQVAQELKAKERWKAITFLGEKVRYTIFFLLLIWHDTDNTSRIFSLHMHSMLYRKRHCIHLYKGRLWVALGLKRICDTDAKTNGLENVHYHHPFLNQMLAFQGLINWKFSPIQGIMNQKETIYISIGEFSNWKWKVNHKEYTRHKMNRHFRK